LRREKELEEYQRAREELEKEILEFLERNSGKHTLAEVAKAIKIPAYWKNFDWPQREVIVSQQLTRLTKLGKVAELEESKKFKQIYSYQIKS